jgi:hypothetical protein
VGDRRLPSVSHIMSEMSKQYYTDINPEVLENARERGTRVHKAIEMAEQFGVYDEEVKDYVVQYLKVKSAYKFVPIAQELRITNLEYCGTVDMLAILNDELILIDLKATSKINTELVEVQMAGYVNLLTHYGIDIKTVKVLHLTAKSGKLKTITPNFNMWNQLCADYERTQDE